MLSLGPSGRCVVEYAYDVLQSQCDEIYTKTTKLRT